MLKSRESGIELLRLLAIGMIVVGHLVGQSCIASTGSSSQSLALFLSGGTRVAVNVFLLIGCWFMVDAKFRAERIVKLYLQVALYTIPITAIMILLGAAGGSRNIIQGFLPFLGRPLWFATAYISLIALTPFLNFIFQMDDRALGRFVMVLAFVFSFVATIPAFTAPEYPADMAWFVLVYVFVGWAKRVRFFDRLPGAFLSGLLGFALLAGLSAARFWGAASFAVGYWLDHLPTLPNVLVAVLLFNCFRRLNLGSIRPVNFLASSVFSVYIVHQVPAFREFEWNVLCRAEKMSQLSPGCFVVTLFAVVAGLVIGITVVDFVYRRIVQHQIERTRIYGWLVRSLERMLSV